MQNIGKTVLRGRRTEMATVITKKRNIHQIKRRTLAVEYRFYFFDVSELQNKLPIQIWETQKIMYFEIIRTFFV